MQRRARNGLIVSASAAFAVAVVTVTVAARAQQSPTQTPASQAPASQAPVPQAPAARPTGQQPPPDQTPPPPTEHGGQQIPQRPSPGGAQGGARREMPRFPAHQRPPADPAVLARGRALYAGSCAACHGADARGGQLGGVNLLRSQLVFNDKDGELILPIVKNGRPGTQMPPIPLPLDDVLAIAAFLHDLQSKGSNQGGPPEGDQDLVLDILVGDAKAGADYFQRQCASCHSATGDLQGIGARLQPRVLQNAWVSGGAARSRGQGGGAAAGAGAAGGAEANNGARASQQERPTTTATITLPSGETVQGRLMRVDDFYVAIALADGTQRSFRRNGDVPKVDVKDPLAGHRALLGVLTNKDMHDVTAYLASLK